MGKGKPRHNPDKKQNKAGTWCMWAEDITDRDGSVHFHCEIGLDARFCQGNPHKCKKGQYRNLARRSDRRKIIDGTY